MWDSIKRFFTLRKGKRILEEQRKNEPIGIIGFSIENPYVILYPTLEHLVTNCKILNPNELSFYKHLTDGNTQKLNIKDLINFVEQEELTKEYVNDLVNYSLEYIKENQNGIYTGVVNYAACSGMLIVNYFNGNELNFILGVDISALGFNQKKYLFDKINNRPYKWKDMQNKTISSSFIDTKTNFMLTKDEMDQLFN